LVGRPEEGRPPPQQAARSRARAKKPRPPPPATAGGSPRARILFLRLVVGCAGRRRHRHLSRSWLPEPRGGLLPPVTLARATPTPGAARHPRGQTPPCRGPCAGRETPGPEDVPARAQDALLRGGGAPLLRRALRQSQLAHDGQRPVRILAGVGQGCPPPRTSSRAPRGPSRTRVFLRLDETPSFNDAPLPSVVPNFRLLCFPCLSSPPPTHRLATPRGANSRLLSLLPPDLTISYLILSLHPPSALSNPRESIPILPSVPPAPIYNADSPSLAITTDTSYTIIPDTPFSYGLAFQRFAYVPKIMRHTPQCFIQSAI
jgi:hypothetical protein